jgi:hypothetical protein
VSSGTNQHWPGTFHWWIDSVGGYLTFTKPVIRIGQAGCDDNDVGILADISGRHAELRRGKTGPILLAFGDTTVNGAEGSGFLLRDGDRIRMRSVELIYHQPLAWSSTSRLEIVSRHRLPLALDGIVMLGDTCIVGPRRDAHLPAPTWESSIFINWHKDRYWVRGPEALKIDGKEYTGWGPLSPTSEVEGFWGTFRWEPASKKTSRRDKE